MKITVLMPVCTALAAMGHRNNAIVGTQRGIGGIQLVIDDTQIQWVMRKVMVVVGILRADHIHMPWMINTGWCWQPAVVGFFMMICKAAS